jgi:hypothetical protein
MTTNCFYKKGLASVARYVAVLRERDGVRAELKKSSDRVELKCPHHSPPPEYREREKDLSKNASIGDHPIDAYSP